MQRQLAIDVHAHTPRGRSTRAPRIVEVAGVEMMDGLPSGRFFRQLVDPEVPITSDATAEHGYTRGLLRGAPAFQRIAVDLVQILQGAEVIAHCRWPISTIDRELSRVSAPGDVAIRIQEASAALTLLDELAAAIWPSAYGRLENMARTAGIEVGPGPATALMRASLTAGVYCALVARAAHQRYQDVPARLSDPAAARLQAVMRLARSYTQYTGHAGAHGAVTMQ